MSLIGIDLGTTFCAVATLDDRGRPVTLPNRDGEILTPSAVYFAPDGGAVAFAEWSASCVCPPKQPVCTCRGQALGTTVTRKPIRPSPAEAQENPRARSALLRVWRRAA